MVEEVRKLVDVPVVVCLGADTHCVLSSSEPARETLVLLRSAVKGVEDHLSPTARLPRGIQRRRKRRVC